MLWVILVILWLLLVEWLLDWIALIVKELRHYVAAVALNWDGGPMWLRRGIRIRQRHNVGFNYATINQLPHNR